LGGGVQAAQCVSSKAEQATTVASSGGLPVFEAPRPVLSPCRRPDALGYKDRAAPARAGERNEVVNDSSKRALGFIGLGRMGRIGRMGRGMALNLCRKGFSPMPDTWRERAGAVPPRLEP